MTQADYVKNLEAGLQTLPAARKAEILEDIRMHFEEGMQAGLTEADLIARLGAPEVLAREYCATFVTERAQRSPSVGNVFRAIWAGIGMGMLNLIFVLPIVISLWAVWISLLATGGALVLGGACASLITLLHLVLHFSFVYAQFPWTGIFLGVTTAALGGLLVIGSLYLGRGLMKSLATYTHANIDIIAGRRRKHVK